MVESGPSAERSHVSRWLSRVDRHAPRLLTAMLVVIAVTVWIAVSIAAGFPRGGKPSSRPLVAALTLTIVFVIQHTQARHQRAAQRKRDEILLAHARRRQLPAQARARLRRRTARRRGTSIKRSARTDSMTHSVPGAARSAGENLSVLPNAGPDRSAHCPRAVGQAALYCGLPGPTCMVRERTRSPG